MKTTNTFWVIILLFLSSYSFSQTDLSYNISENAAKISSSQNQSLLIEISGPSGYYYSEQVKNTAELNISSKKADGTSFDDGKYTLLVTPLIKLSEQQKLQIQELRKNNSERDIDEYLTSQNIPLNLVGMNVNFTIAQGSFVLDKNQEYSFTQITKRPLTNVQHPELYASITYLPSSSSSSNAIDRWFSNSVDDQVILDDLVVDGSICIGQDCINGESFGFDTQRLKENNLRIHFNDTSSSASFPSNDWRISINDSNNGGGSHFSVEDATANTTPLRIMAGAGNNAIYVSNFNGNVGLGTSVPQLELQITDGNSPSIRLDQNGTSGFSPQAWDIVGNETNFLVRDVTNNTALPFRIKTGATSNSISVNTDGKIGFGIEDSAHGFHFKTNDLYLDGGKLGVGTIPTSALDIVGTAKVLGNQIITGTNTTRGNLNVINATNTPVLSVDSDNERVGIGTATPNHQLELSLDDAVKPGGGMWSAPSDRRLKSNITTFSDGINVLENIDPVTFNYNGKLNYPTDQKFIGVIAQDVQSIAPYAVKSLDGKYLSVDPSSFTYILINSVKEQQAIIETQQKEIESLKGEMTELSDIKAQLNALTSQVENLLEDKPEQKSIFTEEK